MHPSVSPASPHMQGIAEPTPITSFFLHMMGRGRPIPSASRQSSAA